MKTNYSRLLIFLIFTALLWGCSASDPVKEIDALFSKAILAEQANRFDEAVEYYQQILQKYPESPKCDKALFMAGFIKSEYLNQKDDASKYFNKLLDNYPESDLRDDADFMIETIKLNKDALTTFEDKTNQ